MQIPEFQYIYSKRRNRYYGIGELEKWTKFQIEENNIKLEKGNYRCQCPYCLEAYKTDSTYSGPYTKPKLYVGENFEFAHCFRCDRIFLDINNGNKVEARVPSYHQDVIRPIYKLDGDKWNLDIFELFSEFSEEGLAYLVKKRHSSMAKLYKILGIRFYKENPVIPFYYKGELIYFQIRYVHPEKHNGMKYFSPPIDDKPGYVIEHGNNKKFVIVEGVFDAIACLLLFPDRTPFAVLQHSITQYQLGMLRSYVPEDILVYMDSTEFSVNTAKQIRSVINYANVSVQTSNGEDPEEAYKRIRNEEINNE